MTKKSICIITGGHLATNPRVVKEATYLHGLGHDVTVVTIWKDQHLLAEDAGLLPDGVAYRGVDLCRPRGFRRLRNRLRRRTGAWLVRYLGIQSVHALGYGLRELWQLVRRQPADLYIGHQEAGLYVGTRLLRENRVVAFDFEDWYSEDLTPRAQLERPITALKRMEALALKQGVYTTTTSQAMADALAVYYQAPKPLVVRNAFDPVTVRPAGEAAPAGGPLKVIWFSQTIGPGRGIELLARALQLYPGLPVEIHLLGALAAGYAPVLERLFQAYGKDRLSVHATVSNQELPYFLARYDVGVALEYDSPRNKDVTISNKILQYLQAGIPVVATRTAGQAEVAQAAPDAVFLIDQDDAASLARLLAQLSEDKSRLAAAREASRQAGRQVFNWQTESRSLQHALNRLEQPKAECV